jgi:hypothetical protein
MQDAEPPRQQGGRNVENPVPLGFLLAVVAGELVDRRHGRASRGAGLCGAGPAQLRNDRNTGTFTMNDVSDDGRSAMRKLIMAKLITANFVRALPFLILLGGSVAVAQNGARSGNSANAPQTSPNSGGPGEAPIGHRQPRAGDVPEVKTNLDAEDAALDRKIKSICRGC